MTPEQLAAANAELKDKSPLEITQWAIAQAPQAVIVSTNFRPYEAVILHLCTLVKPDIPVLWVDHGYNRPATYKHMESLTHKLNLNIKAYVPAQTAAHRDAVAGSIPSADDEEALMAFSKKFKLEPFERGLRELDASIWLTAVRKVQNPNRDAMDIVTLDENFGMTKVSPVFYLSDADMEAYLKTHDLPNEWDYFDPAKADENRECGLHVK